MHTQEDHEGEQPEAGKEESPAHEEAPLQAKDVTPRHVVRKKRRQVETLPEIEVLRASLQNAVSDEHIRKIKKEMNEQQKKVKVSSKSPMRNLTVRNSDFTPVKGRTTFSTKTNESIQRAILN